MIHKCVTFFFGSKGENMTRICVRKLSAFSYTLDDSHDTVSDVTNQTMAFREDLTLEEVLKRFKEAEESKTNKGTKKERRKCTN